MDEEEISGLSGLAALTGGGGGGGSLDDGDKQFARDILRNSPSRSATDRAFESMEADAERTRQLLRQARERLLARPAYDERDKYLALAAALGSPTKTGNIGESIGFAARALREQNALRQQMTQQRDSDVLGLDRALIDVDSTVGSSRRALTLKREELENRLKGQALQALKGGKGATIDGVPMSVKETEAFLSWPKWKQDAHMRLKRANQYRNIAGIETEIDPTGGTRPLTNIDEVAGNAATEADAKTEAAKLAENRVKALQELPNAINASKDLQALIQRVRKHPGLPGGVGLSVDRLSEFVAGTPVRDFAELSEQLTSNSFVQVVQNIGTMAGLTNIEGEKLQTALVNLRRSQSEKQYRENLDLFEKQAQRTMALMEERLKTAQSGPARRRTAGPGAGASPGQPSAPPGQVRKYTRERGLE
jgi:hypothetical protein